jgi:hypothetical protein
MLQKMLPKIKLKKVNITKKSIIFVAMLLPSKKSKKV